MNGRNFIYLTVQKLGSISVRQITSYQPILPTPFHKDTKFEIAEKGKSGKVPAQLAGC